MTKEDLKQIKDIMVDTIKEFVPPIVSKQILEMVPNIVNKQIQDSVPSIINKQIQDTVPCIVDEVVDNKISENNKMFLEAINTLHEKTIKEMRDQTTRIIEIHRTDMEAYGDMFNENRNKNLDIEDKIESNIVPRIEVLEDKVL